MSDLSLPLNPTDNSGSTNSCESTVKSAASEAASEFLLISPA